MSVETYSPEQTVSVTDAAQAHFRKQLQGRENGAVRLSIKQSGCTGYKYELDVVDALAADDLPVELDDGLTLYIQREALPVLQGTEIDMTLDGLNRVLVFRNPNVAEECGCGESFSVG